jgi:hypothetical protein
MSQHEAGRELDALVAANVMEYDPVEWSGDELVWGDQKIGGIVPRYSTSIAAAWEAVERMYSTHDYWMRLEYEAPDWTGVDFIMVDGPIHRATAPTVPLAICLAALKAVSA